MNEKRYIPKKGQPLEVATPPKRAAKHRWGLNYTQYADYIRSPEWRVRRQVFIASANGHCEICNTTEHLEVHHRTYDNLGREGVQDCTVLCNECRGLYHGRLPDPPEEIDVQHRRVATHA